MDTLYTLPPPAHEGGVEGEGYIGRQARASGETKVG